MNTLSPLPNKPGLARERIHTLDAANRASAIQVNYQTEKVRAEAEHLRQLASAEARRAEVLQETSATLEHLGAIGQEITAHLNPELIFQVLNRHLQHLLDVGAFAIYRLSGDAQHINCVFGLEDGIPLPGHGFLLSNSDSDAARCGRERHDILVDHDPVIEDPRRLPGTHLTLSRLYAPLLSGGQLLGVITIQSFRRHAYGEREQLIFRTLCAWVAIALANAGAQAQLVQQEKLASLGSLVAGFAHQLNTPIAAVKSSGQSMVDALGYTLENLLPLFQRLDFPTQSLFITLMSNCQQAQRVLSSRQERALVRGLIPKLEAANLSAAHAKASILVQLGAHTQLPQLMPLLRHAACDGILAAAWNLFGIGSSISNVNQATERMATIVAALKFFSGIDQLSEKVAVSLQNGVEWALAQYVSQMQNKVLVTRDYQDIPALACIPDQIRQVWANLIHNALQAMQYHGTLGIGIGCEGGNAVVTVQDTGSGIPEAIQGRIFDAFFTTKSVGEGSGLGLTIAKMIVEKHQGRIEVESSEGKGARFSVFLPWQVN
jgi:two-component system, NtrC family, sensor kinase